MSWYLILTRPRFEASAARHISRSHSRSHSQSEVYYPTKPDPQNPNNKIAAISGYILARFDSEGQPCVALPTSTELARCVSANPRYLMTYSHTIPDPQYQNERFYTNPEHQPDKYKPAKIDIYHPHTIADDVVANLSSSLQQNTAQIISSIIGKKVRIPSGLCMGLTAKVKKISYDAKRPGDPICLVRICDKNAGILHGTRLSFTLSELS